jgi:hypothetical protein
MNSPANPQPFLFPESLSFLRMLWAFTDAIEATSDSMEDRIGVGGGQRLLLRLVGISPGISDAQLRALVPGFHGTLTRLVAELVEGEYLIRRDVEGGESGLFLGRRGATINASMTGTVESAVTRALDESTPYERAAFCRFLERLAAYLELPARPGAER